MRDRDGIPLRKIEFHAVHRRIQRSHGVNDRKPTVGMLQIIRDGIDDAQTAGDEVITILRFAVLIENMFAERIVSKTLRQERIRSSCLARTGQTA